GRRLAQLRLRVARAGRPLSDHARPARARSLRRAQQKLERGRRRVSALAALAALTPAAGLKEPRRSSLCSVVDETAAAIEGLYRERYVRFRNGIAPVTGSYEAAHDAVQEGFARALRASGQYSGRGSLEGWVWRIVLRTAIEQRRPGEEVPLDEVDPGFVEPERDFALTN